MGENLLQQTLASSIAMHSSLSHRTCARLWEQLPWEATQQSGQRGAHYISVPACRPGHCADLRSMGAAGILCFWGRNTQAKSNFKTTFNLNSYLLSL